MSVYELYKNHHEFDIKLDLKKALISILTNETIKERKTRIRILYVLIQRFYHNRSLESIAQDIGVNRERVRQLQQKGLALLKHPRHGLFEDRL